VSTKKVEEKHLADAATLDAITDALERASNEPSERAMRPSPGLRLQQDAWGLDQKQKLRHQRVIGFVWAATIGLLIATFVFSAAYVLIGR
jgi:hypothetical protein